MRNILYVQHCTMHTQFQAHCVNSEGRAAMLQGTMHHITCVLCPLHAQPSARVGTHMTVSILVGSNTPVTSVNRLKLSRLQGKGRDGHSQFNSRH